jgi:hypothetical protein
LQNVNQVGADGSTLNYNVTGNTSFTDPYTKQTYQLPQYTATQKLSAPAQAIFDTRQGAEQNLATSAENLSGNVANTYSQAWNPDTSAIESRLYDLGSRTLDTTFGRQISDLGTNLSNQGIKLGSAAYDRAMSEVRANQQNAYSDLALKGRAQAYNELQGIRNQPLNELTALMSGSQVAMPNYNVNQPSPIATTDNAGLIQSKYNSDLNNWQQQNQQSQQLWGGLLGLGAAGITGGIGPASWYGGVK